MTSEKRTRRFALCEKIEIPAPILTSPLISPIKGEIEKDAADSFRDVLESVGRSENGAKVKKHLNRHPSEQSIGGT